MEWEKHKEDHQQEQQQRPLLLLPSHQEPLLGQQILEGQPPKGVNSGGGVAEAATTTFVKVMTDEQMEILQKQIAAYASISEQLENLHRSLNSPHNDPGSSEFMQRSSIINPYCSPLMMNSNCSSSHLHNQHYYGQPRISRRQRWNPTSEQLHILEQIFDQGNEAPSKERIKDITAELAKHGQIAETNVYNWFQNRRARFKKKQIMSAISESSEGEMVDETSSKSNNGENPESSEQLIINGDGNFSDVVSVCVDKDLVQHAPPPPPMFSTEGALKATNDGGGTAGSFGEMGPGLHGRMLSSQAILDYLTVNPESYYPCIQAENYNNIE